jgi:hypothetical protein
VGWRSGSAGWARSTRPIPFKISKHSLGCASDL